MPTVPPQWIASILAGFVGGLGGGILQVSTSSWENLTLKAAIFKILVILGWGLAGALAGAVVWGISAVDTGWNVEAKPGATAVAVITGLAGVDYLRRWRDIAKSQAANAELREATGNLASATELVQHPRGSRRRGG